MAGVEAVVAEEGQGVEGMVLSLLSTRMEAGTAIVVMLGVEAEEEDEVSVAGDVAATMDLSLIGSKMEDTIMKPLLKVAVVVAVAGEDIVEGAVGLDQMGRTRQLHEEVAVLE